MSHSRCPCPSSPNVVCQDEYDYIVIGSGSAGAIIAKELSDNFYHSVLLLEQGDYLPNDHKVLDTSDLSNNLRSPNTYKSHDKGIVYGMMVGGSSGHNYFLASRASPIYHAHIGKEHGNEWDYENALHIYKKLEDFNGKLTPNRSMTGMIGIHQYPSGTSPFIQQFPSILSKLTGAPIDQDYNDGHTTVIGTSLQKFQHRNKKLSHTGQEFLGPHILLPGKDSVAQGKGNRKLTLHYNTYVMKILFEGNRAYGVEALINGETKKFCACKKIILSAGTIENPLILIRSGIGPHKVLQDLNIKPQLVNSSVGTQVSFSYGPVMIVDAPKDMIDDDSLVSFLSLNQGNQREVEIIFTPTPPQTDIFPVSLQNLFHLDQPLNPNRKLLYVLIRLLQPRSKGTIQPISSTFYHQPDINFTPYSDPYDLQTAQSAVLLVKRAFDQLNQELGKNDYIIRFPPLNDFNNPTQLTTLIKNTSVIPNFYASSVPMGKSGENSLVNNLLQVHGLSGLMVADLSVMPLPDADPGLVAMYVGKRAVQIIHNQMVYC